MINRRFLAVLCALAGTLILAPAASAKGTPGSGSSLKLVLMNSSDGLPHYGQNVTFSVSTSATTQPYVRLNCYQGSAWVYTSSVGYFASWPWEQYFTLASGNWTSGAANCTATLYAVSSRNKEQDLATLSFYVYP
jgi:hypothetical protein